MLQQTRLAMRFYQYAETARRKRSERNIGTRYCLGFPKHGRAPANARICLRENQRRCREQPSKKVCRHGLNPAMRLMSSSHRLQCYQPCGSTHCTLYCSMGLLDEEDMRCFSLGCKRPYESPWPDSLEFISVYSRDVGTA